MKKRYSLAGIGAAMACTVVLSGCSSTMTAQVPDVIQVQNVSDANGTLTVECSETVKVVPDMAEIVFSVRTENSDAGKCQQENTDQVNQLVEYLKGQGFAESSIKTSDFSLNPQYSWNDGKQKLLGYEMNTQVTVSDVPVEQAGTLLSEGVANGANEIWSVSFSSSEYDKAYDEALAKAVERARSKADALATAGGREVAQLVSVEESNDYQWGKYYPVSNTTSYEIAEDSASGATKMEVSPGEMEVSAQIKAVFAMAQ